MQATRGAVVSFNYTLTDDNGAVIDSSNEGAPLSYLHGYDNIIPGLEKALEGAEIGFKKKVVIEAAEAYGENDDDAVFEIKKDKFPPDMEIEVGMTFAGETPNGDLPLRVVGLKEDRIVVDANHPLAGLRLTFDVEVVGVRDATEEELAEGYPQQ